MIFGAYPGIELRQRDSSRVDAEVDVLAILRSGALMVGECKTNARGLTQGELNNLWKAADAVGARATFAATLDRAGNCGELWRAQASPSGRPHFSLTAEHLFDLQASPPLVNEDLFEWRDNYPARFGTQEPQPPEAIDKAFSDYLEGTDTDYDQIRRAPWMTPDFIDPTRIAEYSEDAAAAGETPGALT
jgi:hypothetical protein